jgi:hypothetical protein
MNMPMMTYASVIIELGGPNNTDLFWKNSRLFFVKKELMYYSTYKRSRFAYVQKCF